MRIGWAMQISPGGQAEKKSGKERYLPAIL